MKNRMTSEVSLTKLIFIGTYTVFLILMASYGDQAESSQWFQNKPEPTKKLFSQGETLYRKQCSICHGAKGAGDGRAAFLLKPKPRDFTDEKFRFISTKNRKATDKDLFKVISRGMAGSSMPPWAHLSEEERWALVYYVRYLSEVDDYVRSGELTEEMIKDGLSWDWIQKIIQLDFEPADKINVPEEPEVTEMALQRGRDLFVSSCAGCHGLKGKGDGQEKMEDDKGRPLKPRDLTAGVYKADSSSEELYYRMIAGMPGSPMPSYQGTFTQEQIWDLIHYVQTLSNKEEEKRNRLQYSQILARRTNGEIASDPLAGEWLEIEPQRITITPLWWRNDRVEAVYVRAVHNDKDIAVHLTWSDPNKNDDLVKQQSFADGAALQFSAEKDPPFFGMGSAGEPVTIWHWKAAWERREQGWPDIETQYPNTAMDFYESQKNYQYGSDFKMDQSKTKFHDPKYVTGWGAGNPLSDPTREDVAEEGRSEGFGSYTAQRPKREKVKAVGKYANGQWHVTFVRSLKPVDREGVAFSEDKPLSIAFAIWNGDKQDRNGQKIVSIWNELILEK